VTAAANWSEQRRATVPLIASVLYGVVAVMTVDLAAQPERLSYSDAVLGALLIGLATAMTRLFVRVVTKEAEIGAHLPIKETGVHARHAVSRGYGTLNLLGRLDHDKVANFARRNPIFRRRGCFHSWVFIELHSGS
jgi:hypothetical protein